MGKGKSKKKEWRQMGDRVRNSKEGVQMEELEKRVGKMKGR